MNLYTDNGYLDMGAVISEPYPFIIIKGARGCGKTYEVKKFLKQKRVCRWCGQEIESPGEAEYIETKRGQVFYIHTGCAYTLKNVRRSEK